MTRPIRHLVAAVILLLASASFALGAPSVSIDSSNSGKGVYTVQGSGMDSVAGFELVLSYDTTALASPSVSQGALASGAMFAANPTFSNSSIKIAVVSGSALPSSGQIATITFATHTGGSVSVASFNPINNSGGAISGTIGDTTSDSTTTGTTTSTTTGTTTDTTTGTTTSTTTGSSSPTYLGTVTMPSDSEAKPVTAGGAPAPATETAVKQAEAAASIEAPTPVAPAPGKPTTDPKKAEAISVASNTAVLERFRAYQGAKTPAILIALFKQPISPSFRQEPFAALSDGTTTVTIVAGLSSETGGSPNFALNGAKLVSLKKDDASSTWLIEALPPKGALNASLMVLSEDHVTEYPLTIAPVIPNAGSTETKFAAFLKDAAKTPARHDLNGDGKYDGTDDYIYTANYLVRQQKAKPATK